MKVAILGYGLEGQSSARHWHKQGADITVCDERTDLTAESPDYQLKLGPDHLNGLEEFDLLVRTPVLRPETILKANPSHPDIAAKITSNVNEFLAKSLSRQIIGVTGTKGKGTTSTLIAKILAAGGKKVHLGGNIGIPALELLEGTGALGSDVVQGAGEARTEPYKQYGEGELETATQQHAESADRVLGSAQKQVSTAHGIQPEDWVVLELSSYQLIDLKKSPHIGVCVMVVPEHLDWHTDHNEYITAKQQLFRWQSTEDLAIYNSLNEASKQVVSASKGQKKGYEVPPLGKTVRSREAAYVEGETIFYQSTPVAEVKNIKLLGRHNLENICAALSSVWEATQDLDAIRRVFYSFSGLEHRLELVRESGGIKYYNDSFGTTPETAIVALQAFNSPKVVILGGSDKGSPFDSLANEVVKSNVRHAILIGDTAPKLEELLKKRGFSHLTTGLTKMEDIVKKARELALSGDIVLLSPGCASFGLFENYKDRGEQFKTVVQALS